MAHTLTWMGRFVRRYQLLVAFLWISVISIYALNLKDQVAQDARRQTIALCQHDDTLRAGLRNMLVGLGAFGQHTYPGEPLSVMASNLQVSKLIIAQEAFFPDLKCGALK